MRSIRRLLACVALGSGLLLSTTPASAQTYTGVRPPALGAVANSDGQRPATTPGAVSANSGQRAVAAQVGTASTPVTGAQAPVSRLALTGTDIMSLVLLALPLIVVGAVLARRARPQRTLSA